MVSNLLLANHFFDHGYSDILYAVGIVPNKLHLVAELMTRGCDLKIVLDNLDMAKLVIEKAKSLPCSFKVMIELDTDGHRSGADRARPLYL